MPRRPPTPAHASLAVPDHSGFSVALERAREGDIDLESALALVKGASQTGRSRELFAAASKARDKRVGRKVVLTAHLHMVTRCEISPSCNYCSLASSIPAVQDEREKLTLRALRRAARYAVDRGVQSLVLVGGTNLAGSDAPLRRAVEVVREVTALPLAIDVGPSIAPGTVEWLKRRNAGTIYCSLETTNARVFRRAKPGDDLSARIAFNAMLERQQATSGNVVMNGLGSLSDLLRSVLFLRRFRRMKYLSVSTFHPVPGTPWAGRRPASLLQSLKVLAVARFVFPSAHLGLAEVEVEDPGSAARVTSQLRAGGGDTFAGLLVYRNRRVDHLDAIRREVSREGFFAA